MRVVKIVYDNNCKHIIELFKEFEDEIFLELYNYDSKERKNCIPILTRFGTKNKPLVVFEDENQIEYGAIWAEGDEKLTTDAIRKYLNE